MVDDKLLQEVKEYIRVSDYGDEQLDKKVNKEIKTFILSLETFF